MLTIEFVTDLEGCWERLEDYLSRSEILKKDANGLLTLNEGAHFVFGGDAVDRGAGGMRILSTLVTLKERFPSRVSLLLGNRDLNKMRLLNELRDMGAHPDWAELTRRVQALLHKMNARTAFEFRRAELAEAEGLSRQALAAIDDQKVCRSLIRDLEEGGWLRRYLSLGQLAAVIDGNLFTHGAIRKENLGFVPDRADPIREVRCWVDELNDWGARQIRAWEKGVCGKGERQPGQGILEYQQPRAETPGRNDHSVVYGRCGDESNNAHLPDRSVLESLKEQGVRRAVSGHTPQGEFPTVLREKGIEIVIGDVSYSQGHRCPIIQLKGDQLKVESILPSGERVVASTCIGNESVIGQLLSSGHLVRGCFENGDLFLFRYLPGFRGDVRRVPANRLGR